MIFALLIALGFGLYYAWPQLDPQIAVIYNESPEHEYFEEEKVEVAP